MIDTERPARRHRRRDRGAGGASMVTKPKPPVFHIPIGYRRDDNGEVVSIFDDGVDPASASTGGDADWKRAMGAWHDMTLSHPTTLAAGACVIIGATRTMCFDLRSHTMIQSPSAEGAWQPSALSDFEIDG